MSIANKPIGAIVSLAIIPSVGVGTFSRTRTSCQLTLAPGASWTGLDARDIDVSVKGKDTDAGVVYTVSGSFRCPESDKAALDCLDVFGREMLIKAMTASGKVYIIGTPDCPLTITDSMVTPSGMATFSGYQCLVEGALPHQQLILVTS